MKPFSLLTALFISFTCFAQGVKEQNPELFSSIINKHIRYIEKDANGKPFYILTKIHPDTSTNKRFPITITDTFNILNLTRIVAGKATYTDHYSDNTLPLYTFHTIKTNTAGEVRLVVRSSQGEWGGATVAYIYKKKRKSYKLIKKSLLSIS